VVVVARTRRWLRVEPIVVAGSLAQKPNQGGHTWQFLQYLLGFRRLGYDAIFVDWLDAGMCTDGEGLPCSVEDSVNAAYVAEVMRDFALEDSFALLHDGETIGLSRPQVLERVAAAPFLLNVMGFLKDEELLGAAQKRVFLDTDPGFGQMWRDLGLADIFEGHDVFVTIGENIGSDNCAIPACGLDWIRTPQPVVLEQWASSNGEDGRFTSIGAWRGPYGPVEYKGESYGQRVHEFRKFASLPRLTGREFEVALDIHPADAGDLELLQENGWSVASPAVVARDPHVYREYVQRSRAEFMVARGMYVKTRCGWFSERSQCYLAAGRPVLAQDTGLDELYPSGEGLLLFRTLDEATAGVEEISRDYARHCRAARELAAEYFDSDKVLPRLVDALAAA
jgi:hypothetical protein